MKSNIIIILRKLLNWCQWKVKLDNHKIIYNHFKSVFEIIKSVDNTIVTDFKMGENSKGEPLRWTYEEIKRRENNGITFDDVMKQKSIIKMDIVTLLNGRFIEISKVYNIYIDGESNSDYSLENIRRN